MLQMLQTSAAACKPTDTLRCSPASSANTHAKPAGAFFLTKLCRAKQSKCKPPLVSYCFTNRLMKMQPINPSWTCANKRHNTLQPMQATRCHLRPGNCNNTGQRTTSQTATGADLITGTSIQYLLDLHSLCVTNMHVGMPTHARNACMNCKTRVLHKGTVKPEGVSKGVNEGANNSVNTRGVSESVSDYALKKSTSFLQKK